MKENSMLDLLWLEGQEKLDFDNDDLNIEEKKLIFYGGISALFSWMMDNPPKDEAEASAFAKKLSTDLNAFWDKERDAYRLRKQKGKTE